MLLARSQFPTVDPERDLEELRPGLLVLARRLVGSRSAAEDVCSESIRIVLERLRREPLDDPEKLAAYLAQTARNVAIGEYRRDGRRQTVTGHDAAIEEFPDDEADPALEAETRSRSSAVRQMLKELPSARDRRLLVRYYLEEEDKESICRALGLTPGHFNRVVFRARNRLRALIENRAPDGDL